MVGWTRKICLLRTLHKVKGELRRIGAFFASSGIELDKPVSFTPDLTENTGCLGKNDMGENEMELQVEGRTLENPKPASKQLSVEHPTLYSVPARLAYYNASTMNTPCANRKSCRATVYYTRPPEDELPTNNHIDELDPTHSTSLVTLSSGKAIENGLLLKPTSTGEGLPDPFGSLPSGPSFYSPARKIKFAVDILTTTMPPDPVQFKKAHLITVWKSSANITAGSNDLLETETHFSPRDASYYSSDMSL